MASQVSNILNASENTNDTIRVEKYRPDTLADLSGHQDILATVKKFVETNARWLPS